MLARLWRVGRSMFDVRRSSFKTTLYGTNVTCECLQNKLALMVLCTPVASAPFKEWILSFLCFEPVVSLRVDRLSAMSYISPCWTPPSRRYPVGQQETIAFKVLIGYKKPPPKWKKPFNGIPVEALSKEN